MDNVVGARHDPALALPPDQKHAIPDAHKVEPAPMLGGRGGTGLRAKGNYLEADADGHVGQEGDEWPTDEDLVTLRKVPDTVSLAAYTVAFVELCERFSYYGSQVICMFSPYINPSISQQGTVVL
jgi:proton-dependent oligopeptide transporter, POT family